MQRTRITLHTDFRIGRVDPRVFGGFLEHMGRAVYEGVYDPNSVHADADGCRTDVLDALARLRMTAMRYPGGNFASGYHWQDGIGPREQRPRVRELAWQSIETNRFGTEEFIRLCRKMDWTPMMTVNLGTGSAEEARDWVEYCNCPAGTRYADLRAASGATEPHGVGLWCLGNEMDGKWQLGHVPADQYAIRAQQAAKMMKDADSSIELVACGTCAVQLPTYMEWDRTVLEHVGDLADYISLHRYAGNPHDDTPDYLAVSAAIDRQIEEMDAVCRYVQARQRSKKRAYLCFDEWNVWYKNREMDGEGKVAPHLIEEAYNPGGRAGRGRLPAQLRAPRRRAQDRQPGPDRERDRAPDHARRRIADPKHLLPAGDVRLAARRGGAAPGGGTVRATKGLATARWTTSMPAPSSTATGCTCS